MATFASLDAAADAAKAKLGDAHPITWGQLRECAEMLAALGLADVAPAPAAVPAPAPAPAPAAPVAPAPAAEPAPAPAAAT